MKKRISRYLAKLWGPSTATLRHCGVHSYHQEQRDGSRRRERGGRGRVTHLYIVGDTKIDQLELPLDKQEVGGLQVRVDDTLFMYDTYSVQHLLPVGGQVQGGDFTSVLAQIAGQVDTAALHDQQQRAPAAMQLPTRRNKQRSVRLLTLSPPSSKRTFSQPFLKEKCISGVGRISGIIIFHLSALWKAKFSILCDVIFLVRLQEKFEIDHSL